MLSIFYGDDRTAALVAAQKLLGTNYEVCEGENLTLTDLPSLFFGSSLFEPERHILIKDFFANKVIAEALPKYTQTPHLVVLLEDKLDKRTSIYKAIAKSANIKEFKKPQSTADRGLAFDIYDLALKNGVQAVQMLPKLMATSSPPEIIGAWAWKAIQNYRLHHGAKEKRALEALAQLDLKTKTTGMDQWLLLQTFLLRLSSL